MKNLDGKIALITGGGQGLGEQITRVLAEAGCLVIPADIKEENIQRLAKILQENKLQAEGMQLDVTDEKQIEHALQQIAEKHGKIDIIINNAGIDFTKTIIDMTVEEFDKVLKVNLRGPFVISKFALTYMAKQKSGSIINIASTAALRGWTEASAYHASKWGLRGFGQALFTEARRYNVKVTTIIAGGMKTPFILDRFPQAEPNLQDPKNVAETVKFVLLQPDETVVPEIMVIPLKETSWP